METEMALPHSSPEVLTQIVNQLGDIVTQLKIARESMHDTEKQLHEAELGYKRSAIVYERLRLEYNKILCELRGNNTKDLLSDPVSSHCDWEAICNRNISNRKLEELKKAGIVYLGDLAQAKVVRRHNRPLSLHPLLPNGEYRIAGVPIVGSKTIVYLEELLRKHNLTFGMKLPDWFRPVNLEELKGSVASIGELLDMEAWRLFERMHYSAPWCFSKWSEPCLFVGDLVQMQEREVRNIPYVGPKELGHIKQLLLEHGLSLGMDVSGWVHPPTP